MIFFSVSLDEVLFMWYNWSNLRIDNFLLLKEGRLYGMSYVYIGISVLIALVLHELAHGFVSYKLGDPTPKADGRLSLNPLKHLDPVGTICLFFFGFGWAKPVMIDYRYYKNKKLGVALVSLAGPFVNLLLGILGGFLLSIIDNYNLVMFFNTFMTINVGLGLFNLIPIPPLDGSKVLAAILPKDIYDIYMSYESLGMILLLCLMMFGTIGTYLMGAVNIICNLILNMFSIF